jgi:putative ABC transport system permease protein
MLSARVLPLEKEIRMDILLQDIRYAARKLLRTPSFTIIAVTTLALAIGATTAVFSIVNGVLLKPLPFQNPDEVMMVGSMSKEGKLVHLSAPDFIDYRDQTHSFIGMAQVQERTSANLSVAGSEPTRLNAAAVGARFFELLGTRMAFGRGFIAGEDLHGAQKVTVLSDRLWRSGFGADPRVIGRTITLNGDQYTVVGVAPASLTFPSMPDLWTPFELEAWMVDPENRGAHFINAIARLRPGVTEDAARRDMASLGERLRKDYPRTNASFGGTAQSLQSWVVGDVRSTLLTMFGAVAFVLLIACANVANLLLVRASVRETEIAVRTALGAGRTRIIRQLVTESVMLSVVAAMIGGALAAWAVDAIVAFGPKGLPRLDDIAVDTRVLAFSVCVAIATGLAFGLVPAMYAGRTELGQMLKESARGSSGRRATQRTRSLLVVSEMALAVVLLVGAGLLIKSFVRLMQVDPGFNADNIVSFNVSLPSGKYALDRDIRRFGMQVQEGLTAMPGTQPVAVAFGRPMDPIGMRTVIDIAGRPPAPADKRLTADVRLVTANFFSTLGMHIIRGRSFTKEEENWGPPPVVVVTETFAKKYFPNSDAIGQRIKLGVTHDTGGKNSDVTSGGQIVGILKDVRNKSLNADPYPAVYLGWGTYPVGDMAFLVRSRAEPAAIAAGIRERVHGVDAQIPIYDLHTMTEVVAESVSQPRFYMVLLSAFAVLALLLAALGIYGVISYTVSQRTRELGIRIALGATQDRVVRLVLGQGLALTVTGIGVGLVGAFWLMHLLASLLFGVGATDIGTFAGVAAVLLAVAALASYLPARRAARVDPLIAMHAD